MRKIPPHKSPDDCCDMNADFYIGARAIVSGTFYEIYFDIATEYTLSQDEHHYEFRWFLMGFYGYIRKNTPLGRAITQILAERYSSFTGKHAVDDPQRMIDMVMSEALAVIEPETILARLKDAWNRGRQCGDREAKAAIRKAIGV